MSAPDFVPRPQLAEDVARFVRTRIFNGTYPAGEYIRLDQLAAELGISVTPVREALFELRGEGLLDQLPRRGFIVLPFTDRDITDVSNLQAYVGGELAARAAVNITDDQLAVLSSIHDELVASIAPEEMMQIARWMLPAMSPVERCMLMNDLQAKAPAPAVEALLGVARAHLKERDWAKLARGMNLPPVPGLVEV